MQPKQTELCVRLREDLLWNLDPDVHRDMTEQFTGHVQRILEDVQVQHVLFLTDCLAFLHLVPWLTVGYSFLIVNWKLSENMLLFILTVVFFLLIPIVFLSQVYRMQ